MIIAIITYSKKEKDNNYDRYMTMKLEKLLEFVQFEIIFGVASFW